MNHYEALGVTVGCEATVIRRAYLAAARRYHPDFHADAPRSVQVANARKMQELNDAWAVLGDPVARAAYDRAQRSGSAGAVVDPGVARRVAREPEAPAGKGWTPRADDDGWMQDFEGWAAERDDLAPEVPRSTRRNLITLAPMGLFALFLVSLLLAFAFGYRGLFAVAAISLILSSGLFMFLPVIEMARGRHRR